MTTLQELYNRFNGDLFMTGGFIVDTALSGLNVPLATRERVSLTVVPVYPVVVNEDVLHDKLAVHVADVAGRLGELNEALNAVGSGEPVKKTVRTYGVKVSTDAAATDTHAAGARVTDSKTGAARRETDTSTFFVANTPARGVEPYQKDETHEDERNDKVTAAAYTDTDTHGQRTHTDQEHIDEDHESSALELFEFEQAVRDEQYALLLRALKGSIEIARRFAYGV